MAGSGRIAGALAALGMVVAAGCGDGLTDTEREAFGAYSLVAINDEPLPFTLGRPCGEEAANGYLELGRENRYFVEISMRRPDCPDRQAESWAGTGIWTVADGQVRLIPDVGIQGITFGTTPAPLIDDELRAAGAFADPVRQDVVPVEVTFTFLR